MLQVVACFEQMNQMVYVHLAPPVLSLCSLDHDDTTRFHAAIPLVGCPGSTQLCIPAAQIRQDVQQVRGSLEIRPGSNDWEVRAEGGAWATWPNSPARVGPGLVPTSVGRSLHMRTADFLMYVQHLSICESVVQVSSQGPGHLAFQAEGELLSVGIQHSPVADGREESLVLGTRVVFKYLRALLAVLQQSETLQIQLTSDQLVVRVDLPGYTVTTTLKSQVDV
jgi:hypothetical protein